MKKILILLCFLINYSNLFAQFFGGASGGIEGVEVAGSTTGYIKTDSFFYLKNKMPFGCSGDYLIGLGQPVPISPFGYTPGSFYTCAFYLNNADSTILKKYPFLFPSGSPFFFAEKNCNKCLTDTLALKMLKYMNVFTDTGIISQPNSAFAVSNNVDAITIYHGTQDVFHSPISLHLKNVVSGGIPYISNYITNTLANNTSYPFIGQMTQVYSRIYRFHAYNSISSPDAANNSVIGGLKNVLISYNPGYVDKENDSINVTPMLLEVADSFTRSPIRYVNIGMNNCYTSNSFTAAQRATVLNDIRNHTVPIQYQTGYSYQNPFGTNNWSLNNKTGEFTFTPLDTGVYLLAFRVEEYRNSQLLGDFMTYRVALVKDTLAKIPDVSAPISITGASFNSATQTFEVCTGQAMSYKVKVTSSTQYSQIVASSNALKSAPSATVSFIGQNTDSASYNFSWTPTKNDIGWHYIYVDGIDTACAPTHYPIHQSRGVIIQVQGAKIQSSDTILCYGDTATLQNWSSGSYQWSVLPGGDPTLPCNTCAEIKVVPNITTSYVLQEMSGNCPGIKDTFKVRVIQPFTLTSHDTSFSGGIPSNFQLPLIVTPAGYYVYQWLPYNIVTDAHIPNPKPVGWSNHNTYIIVVKDSFNCFTVTDTIHVNANTAGVTVVDNNTSFKVYPNPTNGVLHINSVQSGILIIQDLVGKEVAQYSIKEGTQDINLSGKLSTGHYLGHFIGKDQTQLVIKLEYEK